MKNPIVKLIINRAASFIVFLLLVIVLNIMVSYIHSSFFDEIAGFVNGNILFLGLIALIMVLGEVFAMLRFPFNLPYPLLSAAGALFVLYFVFDVFAFLISLSSLEINMPLNLIFGVIAVILFFAILIAGYVHIFRNLPEKYRKPEKPRQEQKPRKKPGKKVVKKKRK